MNPSPKHRRGLANVGNTCYLNSALQALRYTRPFADYFCKGLWVAHEHPDRKGHELAKETATLMTQFWETDTDRRMIAPGNFVRTFIKFAQEAGNDEIRFGAQADAAEAIQILLDGLHTQLARQVRMEVVGSAASKDQEEYIKSLQSWSTFFHKEYSPIVETFFGQTQTRIICGSCSAASARYEPWGVLKLPIPGADKAGAQAPTFDQCIRAAFENEELDDYTCDTCKKKGSSRIEHRVSKFPSHMIVALKRFTNTGAKVRARIPYDEGLVDFGSQIAWPTLIPASAAKYRVSAVIDHLGSSRGGHYVMRVRDDYGAKPEWLLYDDGTQHPSPIGGAAGPDTYVLFLERLP